MLLRSILIQTTRLRELREFYKSVLALTVEDTSDTRVFIRIGTSTLVIEEAKKADPFYHFAINIPANKIEEARSWLLDRRVELLWIDDYKSDIADFRNWHAKSVYFFDPGGNIVELIARFDLKNETNEAFSSTQFLSISEIGLVFRQNEIDQQVKRIMKETGLSYFAKQPPMQQFKVLGNDEGLFIIVTENRNWYPTTNPSGIFPIEILFENSGKSEVLKY
jgi:catechol-2,3-dioxygenase